MSKTLQQSDKIVQSLMELKEELSERMSYDHNVREIVFKINSCLFDQYPVHGQKELPLSDVIVK